MASTSSSGHAQCEHSDDVAGRVFQVDALGNQPGSPLHGSIQDIPQALPAMSVMEPTSKLHSLATWLLGYLWYTCGVLGSLATCLPSIQVNEQDEEADMTSDAVICEPSVFTVDSSSAADSDQSLEAKHKVFLSHSGAQKDFVEQLCVDLERWDRYPFFDKRRNSLPIGEKFPKLIFDAIEQCWVGVVVLSEEFFIRSKWPMLELNAMVKEFEKPNSRIKIIPVFYSISMIAFKDLRKRSQWTSQWRNWALNDKRINVEEWERALRVMGSVNSLILKEGCGDVKLRDDIVAEVCGLVPCETRWDDSHVQGQARSCKVIRDKMVKVFATKCSKVCIIGLYGMGGIGKTTISKALCNDLSLKFCDNVCHIELESGSEMKLLQKALKKLTDIRHDVLDKLDDIELGYAYLKKLHAQPTFLALDNVQDDYKSLEVAQTYLKASYGCESVVLVTARSLDVLKKLNLDECQCLEMPELEENEARSLFLSCANLPSNHQGDEALLKDCIERCHFLKADGKSRHHRPLALKVLGQQLGCNINQWPAQLRSIDMFSHLNDTKHPVFSILRKSFDSLNCEHRMVFMDLALNIPQSTAILLYGFNKLDWLSMVYELPFEDVKNMTLKRNSLLEDLNDDFTHIAMHDLWIEFAVAETKSQDSRDIHPWMYQVDERKALGRRTGRWKESVERMYFLNDGCKALKKLNLYDFPNVEVLKLEAMMLLTLDCTLDLDLTGLKQLKSLWLDVRMSKTTGVTGLCSLTNLVFLGLSTHPFSPCLKDIGRLTNLQVLWLSECRSTRILDLTNLEALRTVEIYGFPNLTAVRGFSSRMCRLQSLLILRCRELVECAGLGEVWSLEVLRVRDLRRLEELPCLRRLTRLRELDICQSKSLRAVPGLSDLVALESLSAAGCVELAEVPDLVKLTRLQTLNIEDCPVQEVPGLDGLVALTKLHASFRMFANPVRSLSKLSMLNDVLISGWSGPIWTSIQSLLVLESLQLRDCTGDECVVPDLRSLARLKVLRLFNCNCKDVTGLSDSVALETLVFQSCEKLERLPTFQRLTKLIYLDIVGCGSLQDSPSSLCGSLHTLKADVSSLMRFATSSTGPTGLRRLTLFDNGCEDVLSIMPSMMTSRLEALRFYCCETMEAVDVGSFPRLEKLTLWGCSGLQRVTCSRSLTHGLRELEVIDCTSPVELPDLSTFPQLERLQLQECRAVKRLICSRPVVALRRIILFSCDPGIEIPSLSLFPKLKEFTTHGYYVASDDDDDD